MFLSVNSNFNFLFFSLIEAQIWILCLSKAITYKIFHIVFSIIQKKNTKKGHHIRCIYEVLSIFNQSIIFDWTKVYAGKSCVGYWYLLHLLSVYHWCGSTYTHNNILFNFFFYLFLSWVVFLEKYKSFISASVDHKKFSENYTSLLIYSFRDLISLLCIYINIILQDFVANI